jgi:hypothetical protein
MYQKQKITPTTLNELNLVFSKIVVDVACTFDMFNAEYVDKVFKIVSIELPVNEFIIFDNVVDVACKLYSMLNLLINYLNLCLLHILINLVFKILN